MAPQNVQAAFRQADADLAKSLGLEIQCESHEDYEIKELIANDWWDDGAWDDYEPRKKNEE